MDGFQTQLAEQVRLHQHIYDSSLSDYRDYQVVENSWKEIAVALGKDEAFCRKTWKNVRDRFVRAKRQAQTLANPGKLDGIRRIPPILVELDWLSQFTRPGEKANKFCLVDDGKGRAKVVKAPTNNCIPDDPVSSASLHLPPSSLHLLVPPLRLMSAYMWQVAQERNVDQYNKLADFVILVTDMVPELLNYKQRAQLILGLRARLLLEALKRMDEVDVIEDHVSHFQQSLNHLHEEDQNGEVETSKSGFVELVQTLLRDESKKEHFFKRIFPAQYGAHFDTALQILVWELLYRMEEFLPVPSFSQVFSLFGFPSLDCELEQLVSDPEALKLMLQQQRKQQKLPKSDLSFMSDMILSTLANKQISVTCEGDLHPNISQKKSKWKTLQNEDHCEVEDTSVVYKETDDTSTQTNLHLKEDTSSSCCEEADASEDDEMAEVALRSSRCSETKEDLYRGINKGKSKRGSSSSPSSASPDCGQTSASYSYMKKQFLLQSAARLFRCIQCNKSFKSHKDLSQHFLIHSNLKVTSFACSFCEKKFSRRTLLTVHLRRHKDERPFACSYCDKRFLSKPVLKSHLRTHTGERPYACNLCDKKFTQSYSLTVHLRIHKKEKPYLCCTCGRSFCSSGSLLMHSRTHAGERPHLCDICGKGFASSINLRVHRRCHTAMKPYCCAYCDKSFRSPSHLEKHVRTHTGEKPYKCLTCQKGFSQKSNLKIHLQVHKKSK